MLINPPASEGTLWEKSDSDTAEISSQGGIWPQVLLAQLAAILTPDYQVDVLDATAQHLSWAELEVLLSQKQPRYYLTWVKETSLQNDLFGAYLAHGLGAKTIAIGDCISTNPQKILDLYPTLNFALFGEPELTLRELIDTLEVAAGHWSEERAEPIIWQQLQKIFKEATPNWQPAWSQAGTLEGQLAQIQGLAWRDKAQPVINAARPSIPNLDDLPMPHHHLLPLAHYSRQFDSDAQAGVMTNRLSTTGDDSDTLQVSGRLRTPDNIMSELWYLYDLGVDQVHMATDIFTFDRKQTLSLCRLMIHEELPIRWTCTSRIEYIDFELLSMMGRAGCRAVYWQLESISGQTLKKIHSNYRLNHAPKLLNWAKKSGIKNWGCFNLGLPNETEVTIKETITFARELPLDLAMFDLITDNSPQSLFTGRESSSTVTETELTLDDLKYWQKRAFREWALQPGSLWKMFKNFNQWLRFKDTVPVGLPSFSWNTR